MWGELAEAPVLPARSLAGSTSLRKKAVSPVKQKNASWAAVAVFVGPAFALYAIFVIYPTVAALKMSLYQWRGLSAQRTFIGLGNFVKLFRADEFWSAAAHSGVVISIALAGSLALALFFAEMLSRKIPGGDFFRAAFLFPNVLGDVVVAVLWLFVYNPVFGALNGLLRLMGLDAWTSAWLGDPATALLAVTVPVVWKWLGFYVLLFFGSIQNISREIYEAARVDGVSGWQRFRYITVPLLRRPLQVALVFMVVQSFNVVFAFIQVMTRGGPNGATEVLQTYLYREAFVNGNFGYGTAIGVVTLLALMVISVVIMRLAGKGE